MARKILAVVAGLATAVLIFIIVEQINHSVFPLAKSADGSFTPPIGFLLLVIIGWFVGSFLAGLSIKIISRSNSPVPPLIAGVILTLSGIANLFAVNHPTWFVVTIIIFVPAVFFGYSIYKTENHGRQ